MTLAEYWRVLARHRLLALIPFVVLVGAALVWSKTTTPVYTSSASVWFTQPVGQSGSDLYQGANYTQTQLGSYALLATKPIVLEPVISSLGLDTTTKKLASTITATVVPKSVVIQVASTNADPQRASRIANAVTREVAKVAKDLSPSLAHGHAAVSTTVVSPATAPTTPTAPSTKRNVLAAGLAGLFLGLILPLVREVMDSKVRGAQDLPAGVPVLATLPRGSSLPRVGGRRRRSHRADFARTESLRKVQAGLPFLDDERPVKVIVLSSSVGSEGATSLSIELARVLAEGPGDVLLIDGDLRRPQVAGRLALEGDVGLADVLAGSVTLDQAVQGARSPRLHVLPAGSAVPNPAELFASRQMSTLVDTLRGRYDYVVIDTPPLLPVADASVLATHADGHLFIARYGKVTRAQVANSMEELKRVDARVFGAVITAMPRASRWRARDSYYHGRMAPKVSPARA